MPPNRPLPSVVCLIASASWCGLCAGAPFFFSTGDPDGKIATASRPGIISPFEIESADDFVLTQNTVITSATFTGLLVGATVADINNVVVEIYRVFPNDSDVSRTSGSPPFSTSKVPARANSPSDVALDSRDSSAAGELTFTTTDLGSFSALNSVRPGGIHPTPGETTGGNGPVDGEEIEFGVTFTVPFTLPPDHYFFVPQVEVTDPSGDFFWLSAPKPITGGTGPFLPDLQSWTRDESLAPDWLRVGTDIVGAGTFNAAFSLNGTAPEPGTLLLIAAGLLTASFYWRRKR